MLNAQQIFDHYKSRLTEDIYNIGDKCVRYLTIQHVCSFPKINPDEMAAAIINDGWNVVFDNYCISQKENLKNQNRVYKFALQKQTAAPATN